MSNTNSIKGKARIYWLVWFGFVLLLLILRFTVFLHASEDVLFNLFTIYAATTWVSLMIINFIERRRLNNYLKQNHYSKWKDVHPYSKSLWGATPPMAETEDLNGFKEFGFLMSRDDLGDETVREMKDNLRRTLLLLIVSFLTFPILFIATVSM